MIGRPCLALAKLHRLEAQPRRKKRNPPRCLLHPGRPSPYLQPRSDWFGHRISPAGQTLFIFPQFFPCRSRFRDLRSYKRVNLDYQLWTQSSVKTDRRKRAAVRKGVWGNDVI